MILIRSLTLLQLIPADEDDNDPLEELVGPRMRLSAVTVLDAIDRIEPSSCDCKYLLVFEVIRLGTNPVLSHPLFYIHSLTCPAHLCHSGKQCQRMTSHSWHRATARHSCLPCAPPPRGRRTSGLPSCACTPPGLE